MEITIKCIVELKISVDRLTNLDTVKLKESFVEKLQGIGCDVKAIQHKIERENKTFEDIPIKVKPWKHQKTNEDPLNYIQSTPIY